MIETNWHVITGAPSSGKTTLINQLNERGYAIAEEVARQYICSLIREHIAAEDIQRGTLEVQQTILDLKLARERDLAPQQLIFFDRGLPDSIAYFEYHRLNPIEAVRACQHRRYKKIFFLEGLAVIHDGVRLETDTVAKALGDLIYRAYLSLGYEVIVLPAVSVEKRLDLLLTHIELPA